MFGVPFDLMEGLLFKVLQQNVNGEIYCSPQQLSWWRSSSRWSVDFVARQCSCSLMLSSHAVPQKPSSFNAGVTFQVPWSEPDRTCVGLHRQESIVWESRGSTPTRAVTAWPVEADSSKLHQQLSKRWGTSLVRFLSWWLHSVLALQYQNLCPF